METHAFLTSWKEIAQYLGKGVRTVQRWEDQLGLPVRRIGPGVKGMILVNRAELDEWIKLHFRSIDTKSDLRTTRSSLDGEGKKTLPLNWDLLNQSYILIRESAVIRHTHAEAVSRSRELRKLLNAGEPPKRPATPAESKAPARR